MVSPSCGVITALLADDGDSKLNQGKEKNPIRYILKPRCDATLSFAGTAPQAAN